MDDVVKQDTMYPDCSSYFFVFIDIVVVMGSLINFHDINNLFLGAGALYGTYEAFRYKVPGLYKIRYIGQTTVSSAAVSCPGKKHFSLLNI